MFRKHRLCMQKSGTRHVGVASEIAHVTDCMSIDLCLQIEQLLTTSLQISCRREKGQILLRQHSAQAYHPGSNVWVPETSPEPGNLRGKVVRWVKGQIIGATNEGPNGSLLLVRTEEGHEHKMRPSELPLQNERDDTVDDLVKSDFLHEPG